MEDDGSSTNRLLEYFRGDEGESRYKRLVVMTAKRLFLQKTIYVAHNLRDPEHYVNEAILRCMPDADGRIARRIDWSAPPEIEMISVIESVIDHEIRPALIRRNTHGVFKQVYRDGEMVSESAEDHSESMWGDNDGAAVIRHSADRQDDLDVLSAFLAFVSADLVVAGMVRLLLEEDIDEPAELVAEKLGIEVSEVYVARKRLRRLTQKFAQEGAN